MSFVLVVVDRFSKYAVFVVAPDACTAETVATLFHKNVVKYFGVLVDLVLLKLTPQIWKKTNSKRVHKALVPKYDWPFEVVSKVGVVAYKLKLLEWIKVHLM
ncbi:hypothetical protein Pint_30426 [Pistacia integerrima]|uniref:Uncharacterized protein n=1 Tax=Pistacia integerrima TaxID=434235 RepID=A0ACC0WWY0_9ROSI|nr:hypothetical protein Pint_30426 [Pistacia integerrima]